MGRSPTSSGACSASARPWSRSATRSRAGTSSAACSRCSAAPPPAAAPSSGSASWRRRCPRSPVSPTSPSATAAQCWPARRLPPRRSRVGDRVIPLQAVTLNVGVLYVFAMLSLGVYGVMMAGWSSANNYALLGGQRAAALMITAEIAIGASIMGVVMWYGSLSLQDIARAQGGLLFGWIPKWGIVTQPLAFILFLTAGIAATKRIPFDMPEGESEIIGYFVEYSGMKFGMFLMTDMVETIGLAGLSTSLFLGGWQIPYLFAEGFHFPWGAGIALPPLLVTLLQVSAFVGKVAAVIFVLMLIRWTLPRFRYDQAMRLGWLGLFPLAIANIVLTGLVLAAWGNR